MFDLNDTTFLYEGPTYMKLSNACVFVTVSKYLASLLYMKMSKVHVVKVLIKPIFDTISECIAAKLLKLGGELLQKYLKFREFSADLIKF